MIKNRGVFKPLLMETAYLLGKKKQAMVAKKKIFAILKK